MINIETLKIDVANEGHFTNTYIISDQNNAAVLIDPADDSQKIINYINEKKLKINYIIITHSHADHIGALEDVQNFTNAKIIVHKADKEALIGKVENYSDMLNVKVQKLKDETITQVQDGYNLKVGNMDFEIIHTPGHTAGGICIFEKNTNSLFTGDTIFCDCYGRCDLYKRKF